MMIPLIPPRNVSVDKRAHFAAFHPFQCHFHHFRLVTCKIICVFFPFFYALIHQRAFLFWFTNIFVTWTCVSTICSSSLCSLVFFFSHTFDPSHFICVFFTQFAHCLSRA
uniref:Uncharacterized protein n=1 Tax=Trypanosoma congolense (strain IL3000) TaxID=1068625 RepID=G0UR40_TRYCI|nr:hypothetical protein, unlikely [Trypanosoma congolense IL3000]